MARVAGSIPWRFDGEYVRETRMGLEKLETVLLLVLSIAFRWKTSVVTAALP